jgi:spermidine synthase
MKTLQQIWDELPLKSDKGSVHSYLPVYEEILAPYRDTAKNVLEIGLFNGASMRMWAKYFTKAKIHGVDCSLLPHDGMASLVPLISEGLHNVQIHIFDAENEEEVAKRFSGIKFDVIIEDAGHHVEQQLKIYSVLKNYLNDDGIYIIEDIQDIRKDRHDFYTEIGYVEIIDLRDVKGRYDDVLIVIK